MRQRLLGAQAGPALLLVLIAVTSLLTRPLFPIDETRYLGVAWEMWHSGDYLVMLKNGEPYSHKPPLLFWLYNMGWAIFGVNEWWPRLVSLCAALGGLLLTFSLSRRLWPDDPRCASRSLWILASSSLWMLFSTLAMFDVLLALCVLLGLRGLLVAADGAIGSGFAWLAASIGLGLLAKGPVILLHLLPAALLAPWWRQGLPLKRWYVGVGLAVLAGAAVALAWAVPAAIKGGDTYRNAIFWGQTANRMVESFAHKRPIWWYLPLLPALLFPWLLWPGLWRAVAARRRERAADGGIRFCMAWAVPVFAAFSVISGKQIHYLVPLVPAFALAAGRALGRAERSSVLVPAVLTGVAGVTLAWFAVTGMPGRMRDWDGFEPWAGLSVLALALLVVRLERRPGWACVPLISVLSAGTFMLVHVHMSRNAFAHYAVEPMAAAIGEWQRRGAAVANLGRYHDQYQFAGRLQRPIAELTEVNAQAWIDAHPQGLLIAYLEPRRDEKVPAEYLFRQPYRGRIAYLLTVAQAGAAGLLGTGFAPASRDEE